MNIARSEALKKAWKNRKDYIGPEKKSSLYTSWRARVFTRKGKLAGFPPEWRSFKGFKENTPDGWSEGLILVRHDSKKPFSRDNCEWVEKGMESFGGLVQFEYNGETKTLYEWAKEYDLNYNGLRQRYFKGKNYTKEQILFGKPRTTQKDITDIKKLNRQKQKNKISKMLSTYRLRDKKKNFDFNLTKEFLEKNIMSQPCIYCGAVENIGCDRIDNKKGHTIENVVPACYICNHVRNDYFTVEEMKIIGNTIKEIKRQRLNQL